MKDPIQVLETKGIRPTAMRIMIYKRLYHASRALSLGEMEKDFQTSERSTLYRTIKKFEKNSIVHQIEDGTGYRKYALCEESCSCEINTDLHLHFHCSVCKETICLTDHKIPQVSLPEGFVAEDANLVISGVCHKC